MKSRIAATKGGFHCLFTSKWDLHLRKKLVKCYFWIMAFYGAEFLHLEKYRGSDKSLSRPGRQQVQKHSRDARVFNNIETRAVIKFLSMQGKAPKEIDAILTETLACFLPGRAKDFISSPVDRHYLENLQYVSG